MITSCSIRGVGRCQIADCHLKLFHQTSVFSWCCISSKSVLECIFVPGGRTVPLQLFIIIEQIALSLHPYVSSDGRRTTNHDETTERTTDDDGDDGRTTAQTTDGRRTKDDRRRRTHDSPAKRHVIGTSPL